MFLRKNRRENMKNTIILFNIKLSHIKSISSHKDTLNENV